jgi:hypothetical protein
MNWAGSSCLRPRGSAVTRDSARRRAITSTNRFSTGGDGGGPRHRAHEASQLPQVHIAHEAVPARQRRLTGRCSRRAARSASLNRSRGRERLAAERQAVSKRQLLEVNGQSFHLPVALPQLSAWHRTGLRLFSTWKSRRCTGRPSVGPDVRDLIRTVSQENPPWGTQRIHGDSSSPSWGVLVSQASGGDVHGATGHTA